MSEIRSHQKKAQSKGMMTHDSFIDMCTVNSVYDGQQYILNISSDWLINVIHSVESELRSLFKLSYLKLRFGSEFSLSTSARLYQHQVLSDIYVNQYTDFSIDYYDDSIPFALFATSISDKSLVSNRYILHLPPLWRNYTARLFFTSEETNLNSSVRIAPNIRRCSSSISSQYPINLYEKKLDTLLLVCKNSLMDYKMIKLDERKKADFQPILSVKACSFR